MAGEVKAEQTQSHQTKMELVQSAPPRVDAGDTIALKVKVACPLNCNLQGNPVRIVDDEGNDVKTIELTVFDETGTATDEFGVKAPIKPGEYTWTAVFAATQGQKEDIAQVSAADENQVVLPKVTSASLPTQAEKANALESNSAPSAEQLSEPISHEGCSAPFSFIVKPHATSMAIWDAPSPIVIDSKFEVKVGVRCVADCKLTGQQIEIYDQEGHKVGTGVLGDAPWQDTTGLYWTKVEIQAPSTEGFRTWEVKFHKPDLSLEHEGSDSTFASRTAKPPEHVVSVEVIDKDKKTPIQYAAVVLHSSGTSYREYTGESGVAKLSVPKGEYELFVAMAEYKEFVMATKVAGDVEVKAELSFVIGDH